jgi:hypothetical protein
LDIAGTDFALHGIKMNKQMRMKTMQSIKFKFLEALKAPRWMEDIQFLLGSITRLVTGMAMLLVCGCVTTTPESHWSSWNTGSWRQSERQRFSTVKLETNPSEARVLVDGRYRGNTPIKLTLPHHVQSRMHQRVLYRTHNSRNTLDTFMEGLTLGMVPAPSQIKREVINRQNQEEFRSIPTKHTVSVQKAGFFPQSVNLALPRDADRTLYLQMMPQETLAFYPVQVSKGVEKRVPLLRWLRDRIFFPKGISESQYPAFKREVLKHLQSHFAESGYFQDVRILESGEQTPPGATLQVEALLYSDRFTLRGQMRSPTVLVNQAITREVELNYREFPAQLSSVCGNLADQLIQVYGAHFPNNKIK